MPETKANNTKILRHCFDHSIKLYAQHIAAAVNDELSALANGQSEATSETVALP